MIEIERVTRVDEDVAEGLNGLFDEGMAWDEGNGRTFLTNPDALLLVARFDGRICGFLSAYRLPRFDGLGAEVMLDEIGTHEEFQRRGVATALIVEVKLWAAEIGAVNVWVLTEVDNDPALGLYAATGGVRDEPAITMFTYPIPRVVAPEGGEGGR